MSRTDNSTADDWLRGAWVPCQTRWDVVVWSGEMWAVFQPLSAIAPVCPALYQCLYQCQRRPAAEDLQQDTTISSFKHCMIDHSVKHTHTAALHPWQDEAKAVNTEKSWGKTVTSRLTGWGEEYISYKLLHFANTSWLNILPQWGRGVWFETEVS